MTEARFSKRPRGITSRAGEIKSHRARRRSRPRIAEIALQPLVDILD